MQGLPICLLPRKLHHKHKVHTWDTQKPWCAFGRSLSVCGSGYEGESSAKACILQPAIRAIYHGVKVLPLKSCHALLEIVHYEGYPGTPNSAHTGPKGFRWDLAIYEGGPLAGPRSAFNRMDYPGGRQNYHLVIIEPMAKLDIKAVRYWLLSGEDERVMEWAH